MPRKALLTLAGTAVIAAASLGACSSGPSYPHSWCGPLLTQFHAKETEQAYMAGLTSLERSGAPVGKLATDVGAYEEDMAVANVPGTTGFGAVTGAQAALGRVSADLRELNAECGQPAGAWKTDNV